MCKLYTERKSHRKWTKNKNQFTDISNGIKIEEDELQHHPNGTESKKWKCCCVAVVIAETENIFNGSSKRKLIDCHLLCAYLNTHRVLSCGPFQGAFNLRNLPIQCRIYVPVVTYRPVLVIIISVPNSWNLSHNSFVSKWHCTGARSSQLHESVKRAFVCEIFIKKMEMLFKVVWFVRINLVLQFPMEDLF